MLRRLASLALCLGLTSTAQAESGAAPVRFGVPTEIPSDGVLPITGTCHDAGCATLLSVVVTESPDGPRVDGHFELVQTAGYERWGYFVPTEPFRPGTKLRVSSTGYAYATSLVSVTAAEPTALDESALSVTAELTRERLLSSSVCCPMSMTQPKRPQRCLDMGMVSQVVLTTTLSAQRPIATQYVYELSMYGHGAAAGSPDAAFAPLLSSAQTGPHTVRFDGAADSYCYTVHARPIVGGDPTPLVTRCIANEFVGMGLVGRSPEQVAQWLTTCEAAPEEVDAGTLPGGQADASLDGDGELLGRGAQDTLSRQESGCQLAGSPAQTGGAVWWGLALVALAVRGGKRGATAREGSRQLSWSKRRRTRAQAVASWATPA